MVISQETYNKYACYIQYHKKHECYKIHQHQEDDRDYIYSTRLASMEHAQKYLDTIILNIETVINKYT